jgi:hypothetical protein
MKIGYTRRIFWFGKRLFIFLILALPLVTACALPVREAYQVDTSLSIGSVQGDRFVAQRFPFTIRIPVGWQATTQYPEFLVEQGYGREGLKETPFFLFNPKTKSSLQIDFSPAGRHVRFNQKMIEDLTQSVAGGLVAELRQEQGKDFPIQLSQTAPIQLKGVPYAARRSAQFTIKGEAREQGWIYAFAEPYQIFIFYLITGESRAADKEALEQALSSFEYLGVR